jgi:hypothetical protein
MNAPKRIPLVAAAAVAVTAIGLTAGLGTASAAPTQTPGTTLVIIPDHLNGPDYVRVNVKGVFPMNEYDAHGFINNLDTGTLPEGGGINYILLADDPDSNDSAIGAYFYRAGTQSTGYLTAESDGIHFFQIISVPKGLLNEDDGVIDAMDDTDEVYVDARFVDGDGGQRSAYSNVVNGTF